MEFRKAHLKGAKLAGSLAIVIVKLHYVLGFLDLMTTAEELKYRGLNSLSGFTSTVLSAGMI